MSPQWLVSSVGRLSAAGPEVGGERRRGTVAACGCGRGRGARRRARRECPRFYPSGEAPRRVASHRETTVPYESLLTCHSPDPRHTAPPFFSQPAACKHVERAGTRDAGPARRAPTSDPGDARQPGPGRRTRGAGGEASTERRALRELHERARWHAPWPNVLPRVSAVLYGARVVVGALGGPSVAERRPCFVALHPCGHARVGGVGHAGEHAVLHCVRDHAVGQ